MTAIEKRSIQVLNTQNDFTAFFLPSSEIQMCLAKEQYPTVFSCAGVVIYIVVSGLYKTNKSWYLMT